MDKGNRGIVFVGVDGGGSACRVRLRDGDGTLLVTAAGGAANVYLDLDAAVRTIRGCVESALAQAGIAARAGVRLGLGLAGASASGAAETVAAALADIGPAIVRPDGEIACIGAHDGRDGALIVAGTGSVGVLRLAGRTTIVGGRGFILGDDGSGGRLGLDAWRRALRAHDGFEPHSRLTVALMAEHGRDPATAVLWARTARSVDFARCVPLVFSCAADGDPVALDLLAAAARSLVELGAYLARSGAPRLSLVGGLAAPIRPYLPGALAASLDEPLRDALDGALLLAGCPLPPCPVGAA